jgi:hypothetical protein
VVEVAAAVDIAEMEILPAEAPVDLFQREVLL